eukprot:2230697-Amphidinium_carterae.1
MEQVGSIFIHGLTFCRASKFVRTCQVQDLLGLHHMTLASISKIEKATENTYILVSNMQDSGVTGAVCHHQPNTPRKDNLKQ